MLLFLWHKKTFSVWDVASIKLHLPIFKTKAKTSKIWKYPSSRHPSLAVLPLGFLKGFYRQGFCLLSNRWSLSRIWLLVTPWTAPRQASLPLTISQSLPKFMSIESVMLSNHLILCCPLLLLSSVFPSIRIFSNQDGLGSRKIQLPAQRELWLYNGAEQK